MYKITFKNANLGTLELQYLPLNINDIKSHFLRSEKFYGVLRQIEDVSFIWIKEAADYIRNVVNAYGVQSIVEVSMQYTDNNIDYSQFYTGILDLKAFTDDTVEVMCRVISSSAESKYLNNIETQYKLFLPSILNLRQRDNLYTAYYNTIPTSDTLLYELFAKLNGTDLRRSVQHFESLRQLGDETKFNNIVINQRSIIDLTSTLDLDVDSAALSLPAFAIYQNQNENCDININISGLAIDIYQAFCEDSDPTPFMQVFVKAAVLNANNNYKYEVNIDSSGLIAEGSGSPLTTIVFSDNVTISGLESMDKIVVYLSSTHTPISPDNRTHSIFYKYRTGGSITFEATEYKTDTQHRCLTAKRAFERLIDSTQTNQSSTTDPTTTYVESELLTSNRYMPTVVTSGLELRKALTSGVDGEMITSISDLWESLNTPFCLGMGLRKQGDSIRVKIDHRSEFFKPTIVYDLGEVTEFKTEFDETYVRNVLNIVYPGVDNSDFPNGIYEYLTKYGYTLPSNYVDNSLEISCPYKVDATSVEKVRTNSTSETQDSVEDDESNFLIRCYIDGSTYYNSRGEEFDSISQTGLQNNTQLFNVDMFAPVAMRFWAWWILGGLKYYPSTDELVMQRNYPNADVAITVDGIVCDTNNISIAKVKQLAAIQDYFNAKGDLFEPFTYTFKAPVSVNFINIFNNERHGVLKFSYKNKNYYGFGMKVPALPNKSGEFRLLKLSKRGESLCV